MKVIELWAENIKRISVVQIIPKGNIVEVSGKNGQGKSSVLDALWWAFGGEKELQDVPLAAGETSGFVEVKIGDDDGTKYIVERRFTEKGSQLYLSTPEGARFQTPQTIINNFMDALTFDPHAFMREKPSSQLETLRGLVKIELDVDKVDAEIADLRDARADINRQMKSARAFSEGIVVPADLPDQAPDIEAITARLANVDEHNAEVREAEARRAAAIEKVATIRLQMGEHLEQTSHKIKRLKDELLMAELAHQNAQVLYDKAIEEAVVEAEAVKAIEIGRLQDSQLILAELKTAQVIADGIKLRERKISYDGAVTTLERAAGEMTENIERLEKTKADAIAAAAMPIPGLAFGNGMVIYNKLPLTQASDAEQLRVSMAIAAALNPNLRVLRIRDGSLLDEDSMGLITTFAQEKNFQIWIERVDSSGKGEIVMEEGHVRGQQLKPRKKVKDDEASHEPKKAGKEPSDEDVTKAKSFVEAAIGSLKMVTTIDEADRENARVKHMLKRFPAIISQEWNPAYLGRVKELTKK